MCAPQMPEPTPKETVEIRVPFIVPTADANRFTNSFMRYVELVQVRLEAGHQPNRIEMEIMADLSDPSGWLRSVMSRNRDSLT